MSRVHEPPVQRRGDGPVRRDSADHSEPMPISITTSPGGGTTQLRALMDAGGNTGMVQLAGASTEGLKQAASAGIQGGGGRLPHVDAIQRSFGGHDVSNIQSHVGGHAAQANQAMGAEAYATGNHVAFGKQPDLHTAAHEAAHVVQQRNGLSLSGGVGKSGDSHERHADAVADRVVSGRPAGDLLDQYGGSGDGVQHKALQHKKPQATVTTNPDEIEVESVPAVDQLAGSGEALGSFKEIYESVQKVVATRALDLKFPADNFAASKRVFHDAADKAHSLWQQYKEEDNRYFGKEFMAGAAKDMAWYEQQAVDVALIVTQMQGWFGMLSQQDAAWLRLVLLAKESGIDVEKMAGHKHEKQLDEKGMEHEAVKLGVFVDASQDKEVLSGSKLQVTGQKYFDAWNAVTTAQAGAVGALVSARRQANLASDDDAEKRAKEISSMVEVANNFGKTVDTAMGNIATLTQHAQSWQSTVTESAPVVGDDDKVQISGPGITGPNAMANLKSYVGPAANAGGAIIRFIYDGEIKKIEAEIAAVEKHESAFKAVVGNTEAVAKARALRDALATFKTAAADMEAEAENMRRAHYNLGVSIDEKLKDNEKGSGQELSKDKEAATRPMMLMALVRECQAYVNVAWQTGTLINERSVRMRDDVSGFISSDHATGGLGRLANSLGAFGEDGEYSRWDNTWRAVDGLNDRLDRRSKHLGTMNALFVKGLRGKASTDGKSRY